MNGKKLLIRSIRYSLLNCSKWNYLGTYRSVTNCRCDVRLVWHYCYDRLDLMETFKISNCLFMTIMCIVRTDATVVVTELGWLFRCQPRCIHRTDLGVEVEMLALEIHPNPTTYVFFSTLYRPPNTNETFLLVSCPFQGVSRKITWLVYRIFLWLVTSTSLTLTGILAVLHVQMLRFL